MVAARKKLAEILDHDRLAPLAALRLRRGLALEELAHLAGIAIPMLHRLENGRAHPVEDAALESLANALGTAAQDIRSAVEASRV